MLSNYSLKLIFKKESDAFLMMVNIYVSTLYTLENWDRPLILIHLKYTSEKGNIPINTPYKREITQLIHLRKGRSKFKYILQKGDNPFYTH